MPKEIPPTKPTAFLLPVQISLHPKTNPFPDDFSLCQPPKKCFVLSAFLNKENQGKTHQNQGKPRQSSFFLSFSLFFSVFLRMPYTLLDE